jgi:hypothetical protein
MNEQNQGSARLQNQPALQGVFRRPLAFTKPIGSGPLFQLLLMSPRPNRQIQNPRKVFFVCTKCRFSCFSVGLIHLVDFSIWVTAGLAL